MKRTLTVFLFCIFLVPSAHAADLLTGDKRLACETILCLSTSDRPSECAPALSKYFSIKSNAKKDRWTKTKNMRKQFLALCPEASHNNPNMEDLSDILVNLGGQCDANHLNSLGKWRTEKYTRQGKCSDNEKTIDKWNYKQSFQTRTERVEYGNPDRPKYKTVYYCDQTVRYLDVPKSPPAECVRLWNHVNTDYTQRPHLQTGENNKDVVWQD